MNKKNYLIVEADVLPEVFKKVIEAKKLIAANEVSGITEAVEAVGISRSSYYKYSDCVFELNDNNMVSKVTLNFLLKHKSGVLFHLLEKISNHNGNILTINQEKPVDNTAKVTLEFSIKDLNIEFSQLMDEFNEDENILNVDILIME